MCWKGRGARAECVCGGGWGGATSPSLPQKRPSDAPGSLSLSSLSCSFDYFDERYMRCPELRQAHWRDAYRTSLRYFPWHPSELLLPQPPFQAEGDVEGTLSPFFPATCSHCRQQKGLRCVIDCGDEGIYGSRLDLSSSSSSSALGSTGSSDWDHRISGGGHILDIEGQEIVVVSISNGEAGSHGDGAKHRDDEEGSHRRGPSPSRIGPGNGRLEGSHGEERSQGRGTIIGIGPGGGSAAAAGWGWPHLLSSVAAFLN